MSTKRSELEKKPIYEINMSIEIVTTKEKITITLKYYTCSSRQDFFMIPFTL